jgi:DNA-binding MarR family transcriptional regulator
VTQQSPKIQGRFYPLQHEEWLKACRELTPAQRDVLYYIRTIDPYNQGIDVNCAEIARQLSGTERIVHRQTVSRALKTLIAKGYLPESFSFKFAPGDEAERKIRDRLRAEIGGEIEVITSVGRIDLLTEFEVIEVKEISNWKEALGKILAYSAFFPEHHRRIHLFGRCDLTRLALAQATCSEFGITVTFEEV